VRAAWRLAALTAVLAIGLGLLARLGLPPARTEGELPVTGAWTPLPPAPLARRQGHSAVWTGDELLVWGGEDGIGQSLADGAGYDPRTERWRKLPPAPLAARHRHVAQWTGEEMVVWGGAGTDGPLADGAAYDPGADAWRRLPPAPLRPQAGGHATWTGGEVLIVGGAGAGAYDPLQDRWRPVPPPPFRGSELVAIAGGAVAWARPGGGAAGAARYERAADAWQEIPPPEGLTWFLPELVAVEEGLVAWGGVEGLAGPSEAFLLDLDTGRWSPLGRPPLRWDGDDLAVRTAGDSLLLFSGEPRRPGVLWDYRSGRWAPLPPVELPGFGFSATWTGSALIVWGGGSFGADGPRGEGLAWVRRPDEEIS
jgi:hypothetical protein